MFDGNKKLTLALIWQLMRYDFLRTIQGIGGKSGTPSDVDILKWCNAAVAGGGRSAKATASPALSFRDPTLADGMFFLTLLSALDPAAVSWDLVSRGGAPADKEANAKCAAACPDAEISAVRAGYGSDPPSRVCPASKVRHLRLPQAGAADLPALGGHRGGEPQGHGAAGSLHHVQVPQISSSARAPRTRDSGRGDE